MIMISEKQRFLVRVPTRNDDHIKISIDNKRVKAVLVIFLNNKSYCIPGPFQ